MRALMRLIAFGLTAVAFVILIVDGTTMISARQLDFTSVAEIVMRLGDPTVLDRWQAAISRRLHPAMWRVFNVLVMQEPALLIVSLLALVFWALGYKKDVDFNMRPQDLRG